MNNNIIKPITLLREEFIENLVNLCNNSGLPFFAVEDILQGMITNVHTAAQQQLTQDQKLYEEQLKKHEESLQNTKTKES